MQSAKDSFYMTLRTRLIEVNPARTVLIRGAVRPGILVEEAEASPSQPPCDVFILRWLNLGVETQLPSPMIAEECEVFYQTSGTQAFGGLDRGRLLSAMDGELLKMLVPYHCPKLDCSVTPPVGTLTQIFWEEPVFGPVVAQREQVARSAKVKVYCYVEERK